MKALGILALLVVGLVATAGAVSAFGGRWMNEDAQDAIEDNDYSTWKEAMASGLTEDRFNEQVGRHQQMVQHMEDQGIDYEVHMAARDQMRTAIDEDDYESYSEAVTALGHDVMSEDDFNTLVEIHELRASLGTGFGPQEGFGPQDGHGMMDGHPPKGRMV